MKTLQLWCGPSAPRDVTQLVTEEAVAPLLTIGLQGSNQTRARLFAPSRPMRIPDRKRREPPGTFPRKCSHLSSTLVQPYKSLLPCSFPAPCLPLAHNCTLNSSPRSSYIRNLGNLSKGRPDTVSEGQTQSSVVRNGR